METRVCDPWALVRVDGKLTLFYVTSYGSSGGGPFGGTITGYRGHPATDDGRIAPGSESIWVYPRDFIRDWRTRPSSANLYKAIDKVNAPA